MRRKYVPDLTRQMSICEANYARVNKLMPDLEHQDAREFSISSQERQSAVRIEVMERFTYTTTLRVSQSSAATPWLDAPTLLVRLYHDAGMAEVIHTERRQFSGAYSYPNHQMFQPDEKAQLNHYLGEWLSHCLRYGQHHEPIYLAYPAS